METLLETTVYKTVGANPVRIKALLAQVRAIDEGEIKYEHYSAYGEDIIRLIYDRNIRRSIVLGVMQAFVDELEPYLYSVDETTLPEQIVLLLKEKGKRMSVAESFTGGGIASAITSVSGASAVFFEGITAYNEQSKIKRLGVKIETLQKFGAVSKDTAGEMTAGLLGTGDCDFALSTTGIAGPNSDDSGFPVGLCFIALGTKDGISVYRYHFQGNRKEITQTAKNYALFLAYKTLKNI